MNPERYQFLSVIKQAPARLNVEEAAWFLGFLPHEIPVLVAKKVLKAIGDPTPKCTKYFATSELERLRSDLNWMAKASRAVMFYRRERNEADARRRRRIQRRHNAS
jgi:hypothetical protein